MTVNNNAPPQYGQPQAHVKEEDISKMTSGEELRNHDFPATVEQAKRPVGAVAVDTGAPPPEEVQSGGKVGTVKGDSQTVGDVGAILDQNRASPTDVVDR